MKLTNKQYDILKWIALIALPAIGTLYFTLATIWGLPYGDQVVGTITAVDTFLGALLGISTSKHNKRKAASAKSSNAHTMSLDFQYEGLGTSEYRWMFKVCFFFANISTAIIGGDLYE